MIISDTCLVFHLFNQTSLTPKAQKILDEDPHWILPPLWREEYANIISKLARREKRPFDEVIHHFNQTLEEFKNCEIYVETAKALKISIDYRISVYDAHFVALALDFKKPLVTEDKEILKNCAHLAVSISDFAKKAG